MPQQAVQQQQEPQVVQPSYPLAQTDCEERGQAGRAAELAQPEADREQHGLVGTEAALVRTRPA